MYRGCLILPKVLPTIQVFFFDIPGITCAHIFPALKNKFLDTKKRSNVSPLVCTDIMVIVNSGNASASMVLEFVSGSVHELLDN